MLNSTYNGISFNYFIVPTLFLDYLQNAFLLVYSTHYITLTLGKAGRYNFREVEHTTHHKMLQYNLTHIFVCKDMTLPFFVSLLSLNANKFGVQKYWYGCKCPSPDRFLLPV